MGRRVTIHDVARRAEVSASAVSHAFNDPERLRATTVERILGAARDLGYAPNPHARALHSRRAGVLGVLVPQPIESVFANPFFSTFFSGLGRLTDARGIGVLAVSPVATSLERAIATAPVDGFVIVGLDEVHEELTPLRNREVPFVIVDGDAATVPSVNSDDEAGAFAAASLLLEHGHRDSAVLWFSPATGHHQPFRYGVGGRRYRGIVHAFAERGAPWREEALVPTNASLEGGYRVFEQMLVAGRRPTALLAVSDAMAIGANPRRAKPRRSRPGGPRSDRVRRHPLRRVHAARAHHGAAAYPREGSHRGRSAYAQAGRVREQRTDRPSDRAHRETEHSSEQPTADRRARRRS